MHNLWIFLFAVFTLSAHCPVSAAEVPSLNVAVAANFIRPMCQITALFHKKTGIKLKSTFSSTGKLYAQIKNQAPFHIFLAADCRRPDILYREGAAERPVVYARGQAVLWTGIRGLCSEPSWQAVIRRDDLKKISISAPETAPYGEAAATALKRTGLWAEIASRLVFAQSVSQAFQYAGMRGADAGFTALSCALSDEGKKGCYWTIPEAPPIVQKACILKGAGKKQAAARQFLHFLTSEEIRPVLERYGYR